MDDHSHSHQLLVGSLANIDDSPFPASGRHDLTISQPPRRPLGQDFSSWYSSELSTRSLRPAKDAFEKAVEVLKRDLSPTDCDIIWLRGKNSIVDVQKALLEAQLKYQDQSSKSKLRSFLSKCSSRVVYYAPIFDTLSQHYPEYVSLAWGAFKFFFTVMINYEELLTEFCRAIANISNVLPRTKLLYELYPTEGMQTAVAGVYAKIIEFVLETTKWYKKTKIQHAVAAVVSPYKISFKSIVDEIAERSRGVDELASTAVKAELRDVHLKVGTLYDENFSLMGELSVMKHELVRMRDQFRIMTQAMVETQALQCQIAFNQQGQTSLMLEWQTESIRQTLEQSATGYGSSAETLKFCQSMRNRRRLRSAAQLTGPDILRLKAWLEDQGSSLIVAQAKGIRNSSIDFATNFLDVVIESKVPIIWALPSSLKDSPALTAILKSLALQAMHFNGKDNRTELCSISMHDIRNAKSVANWLNVLESCFRSLTKIFVIIDLNLIQRSTSVGGDVDDRYTAEQFIAGLRKIVGAKPRGWTKMVLVSCSSDWFDSTLPESLQDLTRLCTDRGIVQERIFASPRLKGLSRRQARTSSQYLRAAVGLSARNRDHRDSD